MSYTKLFRMFNGQQKSVAQIHADHYSCTFEHIYSMICQLRKDFPFIGDKDIQVQKYGGKRIKGITFVEVFLPHDTKIPDGYEEVADIEYVL